MKAVFPCPHVSDSLPLCRGFTGSFIFQSEETIQEKTCKIQSESHMTCREQRLFMKNAFIYFEQFSMWKLSVLFNLFLKDKNGLM